MLRIRYENGAQCYFCLGVGSDHMLRFDFIKIQSLMILKDGIAKRQFYLVGWYFLYFFYLLLDRKNGVLRSHANCHPSQHFLVLEDKDVDYLVVDYHVPYHVILARRKD